jgi:hypothetical protein
VLSLSSMLEALKQSCSLVMSASTDFHIKQRSVIQLLTLEGWAPIEIATGDKPWVHHYDPENKRQSMEYHHTGSPSVRQFQTLPSAKKKIMFTIFWGARGVLYMEFLTKGRTVNSDSYCTTLRSLKQSIRRIRPERNTFLLHHDKARPHCSAQTQDAMTVVPHPLYSPRFGTNRLLVVSKTEGDVKRSTFFTGCRS